MNDENTEVPTVEGEGAAAQPVAAKPADAVPVMSVYWSPTQGVVLQCKLPIMQQLTILVGMQADLIATLAARQAKTAPSIIQGASGLSAAATAAKITEKLRR